MTAFLLILKKCYIDNLFADTWKKLNLNSLIKSAGFTKRSGFSMTETVFILLLWKWLNTPSIAMFSRKLLCVGSRVIMLNIFPKGVMLFIEQEPL